MEIELVEGTLPIIEITLVKGIPGITTVRELDSILDLVEAWLPLSRGLLMSQLPERLHHVVAGATSAKSKVVSDWTNNTPAIVARGGPVVATIYLTANWPYPDEFAPDLSKRPNFRWGYVSHEL